MTFLILGSEFDPCCSGVLRELQARGQPGRLVANPLVAPQRFTWHLDTATSRTTLTFADGTVLDGDAIRGVLVRAAGWIDPANWNPDDLAYVQAEAQAALLGWLWSLPCPVVNRARPEIWYRPQAPLVNWQPVLAAAGLPTLESVFTNIPAEAALTRARLGGTAVYAPLTNSAAYLLRDDAAWDGVAALQERVPVHLQPCHGEVRVVTVVGARILCDEPGIATDLTDGIHTFGERAGLAFFQLVLAPVDGIPRVIEVETQPRLERVGPATQTAIYRAVADLLVARTPAGSTNGASANGRSAR